MIKGVLFDFNGTLYQDHKQNRIAWEEAFNTVKTDDYKYSYEDFEKSVYKSCYNDAQYSKYMLDTFHKEYDDETIFNLSEYKEKLYREHCIEDGLNNLTKGIEELLNYLDEKKIPYAIASMAPVSNFDYYLEKLNLKKWFSYEKNIVCDDGNYEEKNSQYIDAAKKINVEIKDCLIFEDSLHIINDVKKSGFDKYILLNSKHEECNIKEVLQVINDFTEFDVKILDK